MTNQMKNRTISSAHFERLHDGLKRAAKLLGWRIVRSPDQRDPSLVTLADLGLEPYIVAPIPSAETPPATTESSPRDPLPISWAPDGYPGLQQHQQQQQQPDDPDRLPTLEEYVNAGYPVRQYGEFIEREKAYRVLRQRQAEEQRQAMLAAIEQAEQAQALEPTAIQVLGPDDDTEPE